MRVLRDLTLLVVLTGALAASACRDRSDREGSGYSKTSETIDEDFNRSRMTFSQHANERLAKLDARLHELRDRGSEKARQAADELHAERDRLAPKVDEIGRHAREGWDQFENNLSSSFDNLERRLDAALND